MRDDPATQGCLKFISGILFIAAGIAAIIKQRFGFGKIHPGITIATGNAAVWAGVGVILLGLLILASCFRSRASHEKM